MADKIVKSDISVKDPAGDYIKSLEEARVVTKKLEKDIVSLLDTQGKIIKQYKQPTNVKDIKKLNEVITNVDDASKKLNKTREASIQIDKAKERELLKLKKLNSDQIQEVIELKVQAQEQAKINKQLARDSLGLVDAYEKESKKLIELRKKYKNLAVQNKENTSEARDLLKEITSLDKKLKAVDDTVGQNQRSVGKYEKALSGLNATLGKLGIIALITKGLQLLGDVFSDNREGALAMEIAFSKFTETAKVFINSLVDSFGGVKDLFNAVSDSFDSINTKIYRSFKNTELLLLKILDKNPLADYSQEINAAKKEIELYDKQIKELEKSSVSDSIDKITAAFEDNVEVTSKAIDAEEEYLQLQLKTRIEIEQQEKALAGLAEKRQILQDISDDDTLGFITRTAAVTKAQEAAIEFAVLENRLALTKEKLTIDAVKQNLRETKALNERQLAQITTGEQLAEILKDSDLARKVSDINDQAFTAAFVERRNKQVETQAFARDQEEKNRKTARDDFEQELDILEEFTEKRVAFNEKIINSDTASLEQRQKALSENQKLEQDLLNSSIDLIIEQGKASIDLRKDLTDAEKEHQKSLLNTEAIQAIVNEQDSQEIFNLVRKLDLGEIEEKRLKETLKIKKDINDINKASLKAEEDAAIATKELQEDIALQERVLAGESIDLEDERLDNEKDNLRNRIGLLEAGSIERLALEKELNDLLIKEEERKNKKIIASEQALQQAREDIADARLQTAINLADILGTLAGEDEEAQKAAQRLSAILAIAEIRQNLAKEESAIRERNADKENSAALNSAQITQAKTAAAAGVISILATQFAEGGYTGDGGKYDVAGTVHKGEFVNTKDQTSKYGMKGWTASDFDKNVKEGYFNQFAGNDLLMSPHSFKQLELGRTITPNEVSYKKMISEQKTSTATLKKAIEANRPILKVYRDGDGNQVNDENRGGRRRLTTYKKDRNRL